MFCFTIIYDSIPTVCGPNESFKLKLRTPKTSATVKNINLIYYDMILYVYICIPLSDTTSNNNHRKRMEKKKKSWAEEPQKD